MWYAMQVQTGSERLTMKTIKDRVNPALFKRVELPSRETRRHKKGEWVTVDEILFPGYLIIECKDPLALVDDLRRLPSFTRILGRGENDRFVPIADEEITRIRAFMDDAGLVRMSTGYKEGDTIIVTDGPLVGHEAQIKKIDRHKRAAYVELEFLGRKTLVKIGLEVVSAV